ncbi:hypothetical protein BKA70DRAFT_1033883, partial [Coprinopsis sp. MPI-PUGE-AT-0042]
PKRRCVCEECTVLHETGCIDPDGCRETAGKILCKLPVGWKPNRDHPDPGEEDYSPNELYDSSNGAEFTRETSTGDSISSGFRVFVE